MQECFAGRASLMPAAGFYMRHGKRALDVALALSGIVLLSPALLVLAGLVRLNLGTPILFRQERVGASEEIFRLHKFRTMTNARDAAGRLLPDGERLCAFGLFLRRWSLDELPQLFDVVAGRLSLVGPRPLLVRYLPRYTARQRQRHLVRPGVTGLAQVNGRNLLAWERRFELDLFYVQHVGFKLDLIIFLKTIRLFFARDTTVAAGGRDLEEFWGSAGPPADGPRAFPADEVAGAR